MWFVIARHEFDGVRQCYTALNNEWADTFRHKGERYFILSKLSLEMTLKLKYSSSTVQKFWVSKIFLKKYIIQQRRI